MIKKLKGTKSSLVLPLQVSLIQLSTLIELHIDPSPPPHPTPNQSLAQNDCWQKNKKNKKN